MLTNFGLITILYSNCARTERQSNVKGILRFLSLILVSDVLRFVFFVFVLLPLAVALLLLAFLVVSL